MFFFCCGVIFEVSGPPGTPRGPSFLRAISSSVSRSSSPVLRGINRLQLQSSTTGSLPSGKSATQSRVKIAKLPSVPRQILKDIPRPPNTVSRMFEFQLDSARSDIVHCNIIDSGSAPQASMAESVVLPPVKGGLRMPEANPTPPYQALSLRLSCPKCSAPMALTRSESGKPGFDNLTFDCPKCGHRDSRAFKMP